MLKTTLKFFHFKYMTTRQYSIFAFFLLFLLLNSQPSNAQQLSKDEIKQLKKELGEVSKNLEEFAKKKRLLTTVSDESTTKNAQTLQKKADAETLEKELQQKNESILYYEEQVRKLKKELPEVNATNQGRGIHNCTFSVQIGAYKNRDLTQYLDKNQNFTVEKTSEGLKKYMLGYFTSYWEAKKFSQYLDKNGAQTYVVGFFKAQRVPDLKDMTQCTF